MECSASCVRAVGAWDSFARLVPSTVVVVPRLCGTFSVVWGGQFSAVKIACHDLILKYQVPQSAGDNAGSLYSTGVVAWQGIALIMRDVKEELAVG